MTPSSDVCVALLARTRSSHDEAEKRCSTRTLRPDEERAVDAHLGVDVEERQLGQVRVAGAEVEQLAVPLREQVQVRVREHGALRGARGARGEVDRADVRGGDGGRRTERRRRDRAATQNGDGLDATGHVRRRAPTTTTVRRCSSLPADAVDGIEERVLDDQHRRRGRVDEMLEERPAVVDVDRHLHGAEPGRRRARRGRTRRGCASSAAPGRRAPPRAGRGPAATTSASAAVSA